jgi:hypothetical protein
MPQFKYDRSAYFSEELKCWVRLERHEDGEWTHTSGFGSIQAALTFDMDRFKDRSGKTKPLFGPSGIPSFLEDFSEKNDQGAVISRRRRK